MKKLFSLNPDIVHQLEKVSKETKQSQSSIVTTALTVYLMMFEYAPKQTKTLNDLIPEGQVEWAPINKALNANRK